ncbi:MAG: TRAP transporter small permease [Nitrospinota bacterium]
MGKRSLSEHNQRSMTEALDKLNKGVSALCVGLFILLFFLISLQVISRYALSDPFTWTEECSRALFIWICFLGASVAQRNKNHITIDFFMRFFSEKARILLAVFVHVLTLLFFGLLIIKGAELMQRGYFLPFVTVSWLNWGHIYAAVPVTGSIMFCYSLDEIVSLLSRPGTFFLKRKR